MRSSASITIIGAGIVGCSAAYFLSKMGATDIVVVDAGPLFATGGSTSHAPGLVFQTNPSNTMTNLSQETVKTYALLELDGEPCWHAVGSMEVAATPRRMNDLKRQTRVCPLIWTRSEFADSGGSRRKDRPSSTRPKSWARIGCHQMVSPKRCACARRWLVRRRRRASNSMAARRLPASRLPEGACSPS